MDDKQVAAEAAAHIRDLVDYFGKPKDAPGRSMNKALLAAADALETPDDTPATPLPEA